MISQMVKGSASRCLFQDAPTTAATASSRRHGTSAMDRNTRKRQKRRFLQLLGNENIDGLTLLGGEPFEPENQRELIKLLRKVRAEFPQKDIWSYTGFVYDKDLLKGQRKYTEVTDEFLSYLKVLVDGPFIAEQKNISLYFRGSENQRVIDMQKTLKDGKVVLYHA